MVIARINITITRASTTGTRTTRITKNTKKKPKKPAHPYKDLCAKAGDFYGFDFYGCEFKHIDRYHCEAVGQPPVLIEPNCNICTGAEIPPCLCLSTTPKCGPMLPSACVANPNAIYQCANIGAAFEILSIGAPGSRCHIKPSPLGAAHGASNCNCNGTEQVCSDAFPDSCGVEANAIYKCSDDGQAVLVRKLDARETCHPLANGILSTIVRCKCPRDGVICGEVVACECKLSPMSLYQCKKGEDPVFVEGCNPNRCQLNANVDDTCVSSCNCTASKIYISH